MSPTADIAEMGPSGHLEILIDGQCPLCRREAKLLERLDRGRGRLLMTDIAADGFDAGKYGKTFEQVMGEIHAVKPGGELVTGVEVFREAYRRVGLGWLLAWTKWPVLRTLSDAAYRWFARNRLRLTGHADRCETGRCKV